MPKIDKQGRWKMAPPQPDPFTELRAPMLADPDPCVRVCGRISQAYGLTASQVLEQVEPEDWDTWIQDPANRKKFEYARRLALALLENEARSIALGIATRRGQTPMIQKLMYRNSSNNRFEHSKVEGYKDQDLEPPPNPLHALSESELKRLIGDEEEEE